MSQVSAADVASNVAIRATAVSKHYGNFKAISEISFSVQQGSIIGLLGRNGAGKTTLMKMLTGYLQPDEGSIALHGVDVVTEPLRAQALIGYLPENAPIYPDMQVQEYLLMMADLRRLQGNVRSQCLLDAIVATGLEDRLSQTIGELSKGYRQRVGIAQAILHKPKILILDEPTSGLDPSQIAEIRTLIKSLTAHSTVLLSTHILAEVEMTCERALVIDRGILKADQSLHELRAVNAATFVAKGDNQAIEKALQSIAGAGEITTSSEPVPGGFTRWRITGNREADLASLVFSALRPIDVSVRELQAEQKTLETVFRELANDAPSADSADSADSDVSTRSSRGNKA